MHRLSAWLISLVFAFFLVPRALAGATESNATTSCDFNPNAQVAVEYQRIAFPDANKMLGKAIPYGKVWAPGGKPLALFANTAVTVEGKLLGDGAYTMFVIPEENSWTLVISKSTETTGKYDKSNDLLRIPMQYGQLIQPETEFTAYFAHTAPDQCSLRLDLDKARAWVVFRRD
jgi:hypothetical protein